MGDSIRWATRSSSRDCGWISLVYLDRGGHALDSLGDNRRSGCEIEAHTTLTVFPKWNTRAEPDAAKLKKDLSGIVAESKLRQSIQAR